MSRVSDHHSSRGSDPGCAHEQHAATMRSPHDRSTPRPSSRRDLGGHLVGDRTPGSQRHDLWVRPRGAVLRRLLRPHTPRTHEPKHALTPPRSLRLGLALILACAACALAVGSTARRDYDDDPAQRDSGSIHARVVLRSDPAPASSVFSDRRRARVHVEAISEGEEWLPSNATALVTAPGWDGGARGDVYEVWGSLDTTFAADAPSVGAIRARRARLIERPGGLAAWRRATHQAFGQACRSLPADARALVPGMAIGDDRGLPADLSQAMKTTSLTHLTAVSGSHIVIILATVTLVLPARRLLRVAATLLVLGTILTLVGPDASVVRSVCVASVAALGLILGRDGQPIAALCAVVIATLLIDPWASVPTDSPCRRSPRSRSSVPRRR